MKMEKWLNRELAVWREKQIISAEQAEQIQSLYPQGGKANYSTALILFGVIGALLIGGGIILIFGRNWNELPLWVRTGVAFLPLVLSQCITAVLLYRKVESAAWREGIGLFYAISVYACIALIGQVYQLPGNFEGYLLLCSVLVLPIGYALRATAPMLVYIIGVTAWTASHNRFGAPAYELFAFLGLIGLALPHLRMRLRENAYGAYAQFLLWCMGLCGFAVAASKLVVPSLNFLPLSLYFSMLYLVASTSLGGKEPHFLLPLKAIGFLGNVVILLLMSSSFSRYAALRGIVFDAAYAPQMIVTGAMLPACLTLTVLARRGKTRLQYAQTLLIGATFLVALIMQAIPSGAHYLWINLYVLAAGVLLIINGLSQARFPLAFLGTALVACLIIFRFFDTELDFLMRGLAFIAVGTAFLISNIFIAKRIRKEAAAHAERP